MKKNWYSCDGGSICVKMGNSFVKFLNSIGDGLFKCYEMTTEEFKNYKKDHEQFGMKYNYVTFANFENAEVLTDDCIDTKYKYDNFNKNGELVDKSYNPVTPVLFKLEGKYEVLECAGKFYFVKR